MYNSYLGGALLSVPACEVLDVCQIQSNSSSFVTVKNGGLAYGASKPNIENACDGL